jgi:peptide/nickel transport system permease protein
MSTPTAAATHGAPIVRASLLSRILKNPFGAISVALILLVALVAVFAPVLAPFNPDQTDVNNLM